MNINSLTTSPFQNGISLVSFEGKRKKHNVHASKKSKRLKRHKKMEKSAQKTALLKAQQDSFELRSKKTRQRHIKSAIFTVPFALLGAALLNIAEFDIKELFPKNEIVQESQYEDDDEIIIVEPKEEELSQDEKLPEEEPVEIAISDDTYFTEKPFFKLKISDEMEKKIFDFVDLYFKNEKRYIKISEMLNGAVPPDVIAAIHFRECGCDFDRCLHDGTTLGKPISCGNVGQVFHDWDSAALDAMNVTLKRAKIENNTLQECCDFAEAHNGLGYKQRGLVSPYVYSGTDLYKSGMFMSNGILNKKEVDNRPGVAALLYSLRENVD